MGGVTICRSQGKISFADVCHRGMVRIGRTPGHFFAESRKCFFLLDPNTEIVIGGNVVIGTGVSIRLTNEAVLELNDGCVLGDNVNIMCEKHISIGRNTVVTFESRIIDTNFHYIIDIESQVIIRKNHDILIGANNWICNNTTIMKGTVTPNNCIVASLSLLNKDYGNEENVIIAGAPAKIVRRNKKRLFRCDNPIVTEDELNLYFKKTSDNCYKL